MLVSRVDVCRARSRLLVAAMNRSSGIGLTSFGMVLVVVGAILRFATSVHTSGFNIHKIGDIANKNGSLKCVALEKSAEKKDKKKDDKKEDKKHRLWPFKRGDKAEKSS